MMKGTSGSNPRCVALEGTVGESVRCTIHPSRPSPCRAFEASWSNGRHEPRCDEARAKYGLAPLKPEDWHAPDFHPDDDKPPEPLRPAA
jgi:Fe-S-cluster containining protein